MMRLITGFAIVGGMLTFLPGPIASAASNTATTLFPLDGPNQLGRTPPSIATRRTATAASSPAPTCAHPTV
jgi:hypothetical protein